VQRTVPRGDKLCDRVQIGEVQRCYMQRCVTGVRSNGLRCALACGDISYGQSDLCATARKRSGRFKTNTRSGTGYDRALASEIDARSDLRGSA